MRVSVFLRQKVQNTDGTFIIPTSGPVPPGNAIEGLLIINASHETDSECVVWVIWVACMKEG